MSTIKLKCSDQVLTFENTPVIASGGVGENSIEFDFCSMWDGFTRTAVFWRTEAEVYHVMLDENDSCPVPPEVTADDGTIYFGAFGVNSDGLQRTTEVLTYLIVKGAITSGTKPSDPTPDIYTQLLAKYQKMIEVSEETLAKEQAFEQAMTANQQAFEQAMGERQTQHEAAVDEDQQAFEEAMQTAQGEFEQQILDMIAAGLLPDDSVATEKLKDGCVTAEKLAPGVMVDAYTKTETLTANTRTLFGLGADAVPDDAFAFLGKYNLHWWKKYDLVYSEKQTDITKYIWVMANNEPRTIYYSKSIKLNRTEIELVDPSEYVVEAVSAEYTQGISKLAPCYITGLRDNTNGVYYLPSGSNWGSDGSGATVEFSHANSIYLRPGVSNGRSAKEVSVEVSIGEYVSNVFSNDRNAYPDDGVSDGYHYRYIGVPYDNLLEPCVRIATGSYIGTDTAGASNPNSLTFDFEPKLVAVKQKGHTATPTFFIAGDTAGTSIVTNGTYGGPLEVSVAVNVLEWYHTGNTWHPTGASGGNPDPYYQLNSSGIEYLYIAIG